MPTVKGEWIPHTYCTNASGGCFTAGRCLGNCTARRKNDQERRITELERRLAELERVVHQGMKYGQPRPHFNPNEGFGPI